jgi:hypothetical protein
MEIPQLLQVRPDEIRIESTWRDWATNKEGKLAQFFYF